MKWVELKMGQLGVLHNPNYKITALLDHLAMITVQSDSRGTFDCKPLGLIWAQFPEVYNKTKFAIFCLLLQIVVCESSQWIAAGWLTCAFLLYLQFYSSKNTIMFDDLRRNFVMNPQNGLIIKPFRKAHANRDTDQELVKLTQYLLAIADLDDLSALDHSNWQLFTEDSAKRRRHAWLTLTSREISMC